MEPDRTIRTVEDVLALLDGLFAPEADRWSEQGGSAWWDGFYADHAKPVPFFADKPDENLAGYLDRGLVARGGRALDLGCGPGRNAVYLAAQGFEVDAVDLSPGAIAWARERARAAGVEKRVRFHCGDAFTLDAVGRAGRYDLICDSGCFHHLPPHRRISYLALLDRVLAPGGHLSLTCFASAAIPDTGPSDGDPASPGAGPAMGSELPDAAFYRDARLHGGLAYTPGALRAIFSAFTVRESRRMHDEPPHSPHFGRPFLWTTLLHRPLPQPSAASGRRRVLP